MSAAVDAHLFSEGKKRVLCLDGGGIRGVVALGVLEEIEAILRKRQPEGRQAGFVLSDYFDLIVGTSTGSIIATMLALGHRVELVREKYVELGPRIFSKPQVGGQYVREKFNEVLFEKELHDAFHELTLGSAQLRTGLLLTCLRMDSGSTWLQANNRKGKYWSQDRTRPLRRLVRASAAAPSYFKPIELQIGNGETGVFLDGAIGGLNNPALAALLYVLSDEYQLNWRRGADNLYMLSIGTGYKRYKRPAAGYRDRAMPTLLRDALLGLLQQSSVQALMAMQAMSHSTTPFVLNSEVFGFEKTQIAGEALLHFERIDPAIDAEGLEAECKLKLDGDQLAGIQKMDNGTPANIGLLLTIGRRAGKKLKPERLPEAFDLE